MTENDLKNLILDYLSAKGIFHWRNNSGAVVSEYKGKKRFMRYGAVGSPDIFCVVKGRCIGLELKGPKGKQSDSQKEFQERLEEAGGLYLLVYELEDITEFL
jgi:hypothetical protein